MTRGQTPSQTVGPYFAYGLTPEQYRYAYGSVFGPALARPHAAGAHIRIVGQVLDGEGVPINDALVEILQADAAGRYVGSAAQAEADGFTGFGRCGTGADDRLEFAFATVKPGAVDGEAPHVDVVLTMRGLQSTLRHIQCLQLLKATRLSLQPLQLLAQLGLSKAISTEQLIEFFLLRGMKLFSLP